jgi:hypothetical protein
VPDLNQSETLLYCLAPVRLFFDAVSNIIHAFSRTRTYDGTSTACRLVIRFLGMPFWADCLAPDAPSNEPLSKTNNLIDSPSNNYLAANTMLSLVYNGAFYLRTQFDQIE